MTTRTRLSYEESCVHAAADQGITPIVDAWRAAGLDAITEQTGGFCMVASINEEFRYLWATPAEIEYSEGDDTTRYLLIAYTNDDDGGPGTEHILAESATLAESIVLAREWVKS